MDSDFWTKLRLSHDVSGKFSELAEWLSIGDESRDVETTDVTTHVQECARELWRADVSMEMIGSSSRGTAIRKFPEPNRSDLDFALTKRGGNKITDGEWTSLAERLSQMSQVSSVQKGEKAISFIDRRGRPWDLVPVNGPFNYHVIPFKGLLEHLGISDERREVEERKKNLFQRAGPRDCAKILKRAFPNIKGYILELLLLSLQDRLPGEQDGTQWFKMAMQEILEFPGSTGSNPLAMMVKDLNQPSQEKGNALKEQLNEASSRVHEFYHPAICCVPWETLKFLLRCIGGLFGLVLALLFFCLFVPAHQPLQFSQRNCETDSCSCNDCNQEVWTEWWAQLWHEPRSHRPGTSCHFLWREMERCQIRLIIRCLRLCAFLGVLALALHAARRGARPPARQGQGLRGLVLLASLMRLASCFSDLLCEPGNFVITFSCVSLDIADLAAVSFSWLMLLHAWYRDGHGLGRVPVLFGDFVRWFLLVAVFTSIFLVFTSIFLVTPGAMFASSLRLDFKDVIFQQHHFFNAVCLFLNTCLTCLAARASAGQNRLPSICWANFAVQLAWCLLVFGQIIIGIQWPGEFSQVSFLANIFKSLFIVLNWVLVLLFADAVSPRPKLS